MGRAGPGRIAKSPPEQRNACQCFWSANVFRLSVAIFFVFSMFLVFFGPEGDKQLFAQMLFVQGCAYAELMAVFTLAQQYIDY